ncbi:hypothetical protein K474DRAFT_1647687 [Panus rudis PR-1116 ss-1]|nr:hypothetical protein K474DRAFT_1647687 [Panus rudis PR-1116 ss-1]
MDATKMDDILNDTIHLFGDEVEEDETIRYGPLVLTTAPKEGKANTLLADHLFSPSLLLAERIERGLIPVSGTTMIELGAGCALPSLLSSTLPDPPRLVVITDYPDETILGNLRGNVERNRGAVTPGCEVRCVGYEWGSDTSSLLDLTPHHAGYATLILSDVLHFDSSHALLLSSLTSLLARTGEAKTYVAAGKYTAVEVCERFLREGERRGLVWVEGGEGGGENEKEWKGSMEVRGGGLDREQLAIRKGMCRWWVGRWSDEVLRTSTNN